jgi:hypothetical protein
MEVRLKVTKDLTEFYHLNDKDVTKIILKYFKNVLKYHDIEDIKSEIYERLHKKEYIQNFRPFEIHIDPDVRTWEVKPNHAKFSTYICKFIFNYIYAYYSKIKPDNLCDSLDDYNDSFFNEEDNKRLHPLDINVEENISSINSNLKMEIEKVLLSLEKKTKNKGTLICDNEEDTNIAKTIDKYGKKGCDEEVILELAHSRKITRSEMTKLEEYLFDQRISKIEKSGIIRVELDKSGNKRFFLNNPERRSLYNLFKYYLEGLRDKEISEKFSMTVAGVGAMKRSLRKEIKDIEDYNEC